LESARKGRAISWANLIAASPPGGKRKSCETLSNVGRNSQQTYCRTHKENRKKEKKKRRRKREKWEEEGLSFQITMRGKSDKVLP